jgi:hypothetical protein
MRSDLWPDRLLWHVFFENFYNYFSKLAKAKFKVLPDVKTEILKFKAKHKIMGKGKDLFGHYNDLAKEKGPGSEESKYAGILFQSLLMLGERRTFELLEEADEKGKKLKLEYNSTVKRGPACPCGVTLT